MWPWGVVAFMVAAGPMGDEAQIAADRARTVLAERLEIPVEAMRAGTWPSGSELTRLT